MWESKLTERAQHRPSLIYNPSFISYWKGKLQSSDLRVTGSRLASHFTLKSWNVSFDDFIDIVVTRAGSEEKWNAKSFALTGLSLFHYLSLNGLWSRLVLRSSTGSRVKFSVFGEFSRWEAKREGEKGSDFLQFSYEFFERRLSVNC